MDHPARKTRRQKIFQPVALIGAEGERRAHLLDISETGALIHCDPCCDKGDIVQIRIEDQLLAARVAWSAPPRCGVVFAQPLSASMVGGFLQTKPR